MGHTPPSSAGKQHLLDKVKMYKKQNSFLLYAATQQAVVNMCVIYEEMSCIKQQYLSFQNIIQRIWVPGYSRIL